MDYTFQRVLSHCSYYCSYQPKAGVVNQMIIAFVKGRPSVS